MQKPVGRIGHEGKRSHVDQFNCFRPLNNPEGFKGELVSKGSWTGEDISGNDPIKKLSALQDFSSLQQQRADQNCIEGKGSKRK